MKSVPTLCLGLVFTLCLSACPSAPLTPQPASVAANSTPTEAAIVPYSLIAQARTPGFLALAQERLGAQLSDRLRVNGKEYLLLQLSPERVQQQVKLTLKLATPPTDSDWTRAALQDLATAAGPMLESLELNALAELPEAPRLNDLSAGNPSVLEGWWRRETQVEASWEYSIGTGVRAGYIDQGFVRGHPELERRLLIEGTHNHTSAYVQNAPRQIELPPGDHGTGSLLVGFAERDNHVPTVGVAPNADVLPHVAVTLWEATRALQAAALQKPQVIGMNFAFPLYPRWREYSDYEPYRLLYEAFVETSRSGIPLVVPAHNYGEPIRGGVRDWVPVAWSDHLPGLIGVGGVEIDGEAKVSAWYNPGLLTGINARGSNFGTGLIWAPSTYLDTAGTRPDDLLPNIMSGTSAACPFVTAAVALLRSRLPELSAVQLAALLQQSARPVEAADLLQQPGATVPMIQVKDALLAGLRQLGKDPEAYRARRFRGRFSRQADGSLRFASGGRSYRVRVTLNGLLPEANRSLDGQEREVLGWTGIPPLATDEIEMLQLSPSGTP
ncbi:MAG: S8 family peptidase [Candidatus Sericytochromatia bacterium]